MSLETECPIRAVCQEDRGSRFIKWRASIFAVSFVLKKKKKELYRREELSLPEQCIREKSHSKARVLNSEQFTGSPPSDF